MVPRRLIPFPAGPMVDSSGQLTAGWLGVQQRINTAAGWVETYLREVDAIVDVPELLTTSDRGVRCAIHGLYQHDLEWTGTAWQFAPGDPGNGYFTDFPTGVVPQGAGWHLCDGSLTDYLLVGSRLVSVRQIILPVTPLRYFRR